MFAALRIEVITTMRLMDSFNIHSTTKLAAVLVFPAPATATTLMSWLELKSQLSTLTCSSESLFLMEARALLTICGSSCLLAILTLSVPVPAPILDGREYESAWLKFLAVVSPNSKISSVYPFLFLLPAPNQRLVGNAPRSATTPRRTARDTSTGNAREKKRPGRKPQNLPLTHPRLQRFHNTHRQPRHAFAGEASGRRLSTSRNRDPGTKHQHAQEISK